MNLENNLGTIRAATVLLLSDNCILSFVGPPEYGYPEYRFDYKLSELKTVIDDAIKEWLDEQNH